MFDVLGNVTPRPHCMECFHLAQYHQVALVFQYVSVILIANLKVQSLWSARGRTSYETDVDDVRADNEEPRLGEERAALSPPNFAFDVWICSGTTLQLSDYSQQSCGQRIDIKRKLDHDYDYDRDRDRDDDRQDTRALTSKGNISLLPIKTHRDEAIASPSTYTELPSTMKMISNLLSYHKISFERFVSAPKKALAHTQWVDYLRLVNERGVEDLSAGGACTVLAIRVSNALEADYPSKYDFRMYNVGKHRICRCLKTFVLVDSNSREGAVVVPPGEEWPYKNKTFVWRADGTVRMVNARGSGKRFTGALLRWVIEEDGHNRPAAKYLVLNKHKTDENPPRVRAVERLVESKNGSKKLWMTDDCCLVHRRIWDALVKRYGFPVLKQGLHPDS
ncbi:hypothetical protein FPHYL_10213 [Fusarium phyllophilum]|uniref:Uncharacterized protein n=1 Tax=Fusarium phyllophilum TaxID=47803 RepID=A0A8H5J2I3_9HYPO|nr:hypothetical protein FPHYL_10213 [Fusarium phyllophilum]